MCMFQYVNDAAAHIKLAEDAGGPVPRTINHSQTRHAHPLVGMSTTRGGLNTHQLQGL